jgi:hypothetical protein
LAVTHVRWCGLVGCHWTRMLFLAVSALRATGAIGRQLVPWGRGSRGHGHDAQRVKGAVA